GEADAGDPARAEVVRGPGDRLLDVREQPEVHPTPPPGWPGQSAVRAAQPREAGIRPCPELDAPPNLTSRRFATRTADCPGNPSGGWEREGCVMPSAPPWGPSPATRPSATPAWRTRRGNRPGSSGRTGGRAPPACRRRPSPGRGGSSP